MMKTTNKSVFKLFLAYFIFVFSSQSTLAAATNTAKWTIAAEKFKYSKGQVTNSVTDATAETIPVNIMEKLSKALDRNVLPDETLERKRYSSRSERQSLFLQLSSEYKKRDALVLNDYSDAKLKAKIKEKNKDIKEIEKKIDANLQELKVQEEETERYMASLENEFLNDDTDAEKTELDLIKNFVTNVFTQKKSYISREEIQFYQNDYRNLYRRSAGMEEKAYTNGQFEKEIYKAGINSLITGTITSYHDYISVTVELYLYPGAKKAGSITEVGNINEIDIITTSIANQLVPFLTNSMPVQIWLNVSPAEAAARCQFYIDDIKQASIEKSILLESGVHSIQFIAEGYNHTGTSYYFDGNTNYQIDVSLTPKVEGNLQISLRKPLLGTIFVNGEEGNKIDENRTQIRINEKDILGEFLTEDGQTAFFYVPEKMTYNKNVVSINPKAFDRETYIDKRRRWMYGSYTLLMISMIPTFYTNGYFQNQAMLYSKKMISYEEAVKAQNISNICQGISIGCGVFFGYELIRYLVAANTVLPEKAKNDSRSPFLVYSEIDTAEEVEPETAKDESSEIKVIKKNEE